MSVVTLIPIFFEKAVMLKWNKNLQTFMGRLRVLDILILEFSKIDIFLYPRASGLVTPSFLSTLIYVSASTNNKIIVLALNQKNGSKHSLQ